MMVPGSNLLNIANRVIARQCFNYYRYKSRETNSIGLDVTTYQPVQVIRGNAQPVPREIMEQQGLDMQRTYFNFYVAQSIIDIERDVSGDQIFFNGYTFQCLSITPWGGIDGWNAVLAVRVPAPDA